MYTEVCRELRSRSKYPGLRFLLFSAGKNPDERDSSDVFLFRPHDSWVSFICKCEQQPWRFYMLPGPGTKFSLSFKENRYLTEEFLYCSCWVFFTLNIYETRQISVSFRRFRLDSWNCSIVRLILKYQRKMENQSQTQVMLTTLSCKFSVKSCLKIISNCGVDDSEKVGDEFSRLKKNVDKIFHRHCKPLQCYWLCLQSWHFKWPGSTLKKLSGADAWPSFFIMYILMEIIFS